MGGLGRDPRPLRARGLNEIAKADRLDRSVAKALLYALGILGLAAVGLYLVLPRGPRDPMEFTDPYRVPRESVRASRHMAATGTPWATRAALEILEEGGNAFDAGMAALLALNVTYPEAASFPSIAPTMIYDAEKNEIWSYCGVGTAPKKATVEFMRAQGHETMPRRSILSQLIPSSPDAIISILDRYGTRSFERISREARRLASEGFPLHSMTLKHLDLSLIERLGFRILMPYNAEVYLRGEWWRPLHHKDRFQQPDLARTLGEMADAEERVIGSGGSRSDGLRAVHDHFYEGPIAEAIARLHREEGGLITEDDLASYKGYWESRGYNNQGDVTGSKFA